MTAFRRWRMSTRFGDGWRMLLKVTAAFRMRDASRAMRQWLAVVATNRERARKMLSLIIGFNRGVALRRWYTWYKTASFLEALGAPTVASNRGRARRAMRSWCEASQYRGLNKRLSYVYALPMRHVHRRRRLGNSLRLWRHAASTRHRETVALREAAVQSVWGNSVEGLEGELQTCSRLAHGLAGALDQQHANQPASLLARSCRPASTPMQPITPIPEIISMLSTKVETRTPPPKLIGVGPKLERPSARLDCDGQRAVCCRRASVAPSKH